MSRQFGSFIEQAEAEQEDPKAKRLKMIKRQVLQKKVQAVRQGAGEDIVASYEPEGEELKEYSPNVTYQAKGGKKSGKLGKSSVYSLKDKGESKKEFRKSQVKDIKGGYLKTEEVVDEGVGGAIKAGVKRHKDAVEKKKIKNRKAVPYAALAAGYEPEGKLVEHHQKDADGKVIEHDDEAPGTPSSVEEELSRRSKPSAKAKMAKLDAVLKRREERKIAEKQALKTEGWFGKKKEEKKPQKAMDAGARAKRKLQRKEYAAKVSGSEDNVPDEMREGVGSAVKAVGKAAGKAVGFAAKSAAGVVGHGINALNTPGYKPKPKAGGSTANKSAGLSAAQSQAEKAKKARLDARKKAIKKIKDDRRERATTIMTAEKAAKKVKKEGEDKKFKADSEKPIVAEFINHIWENKNCCKKCGSYAHTTKECKVSK